ncbi:hypothetical protein [Tardiphaga alba]|uniref:hypothetical protein n=1 Tax=Tardiphaga alba TaxID=340268 RepID=UPI002012997C|nr:hypothetical protein [Tardiphaga alba]
MLRTGAADLDLLAGGDLNQLSPFNISTFGKGDAVPADLFVKTQGVLTGHAFVAESGNYVTSATVSRWYNQNGVNFAGFGALNGGNVTLEAGGDAGVLRPHGSGTASLGYASTAIVAGVQGGGDVRITIGGALNPLGYGGSPGGGNDDMNGVFSTDRGDITVKAGRIGVIPLVYGTREINDPRQADRLTAAAIGMAAGGVMLLPRDGHVSILSRGDLVVAGYGTSGTSARLNWSDETAVSLFSAGGNVVPINGDREGRPNDNWRSDAPGGFRQYHVPGHFSVVAAEGSIYLGGRPQNISTYQDIIVHVDAVPDGGLELLARNSIYGAATHDTIHLTNPVRFDIGGGAGSLYDGDDTPIRIYAVTGDLVNVVLGQARVRQNGNVDYVGAKAARVMAGRDMVGFGLITQALDDGTLGIQPSFILHNDANDVSVISAGRNMYYTNVEIAGPGTLEVTAGGDIYQGYKGGIASLGPIAPGDNRPGASIAVMAGQAQRARATTICWSISIPPILQCPAHRWRIRSARWRRPMKASCASGCRIATALPPPTIRKPAATSPHWRRSSSTSSCARSIMPS